VHLRGSVQWGGPAEGRVPRTTPCRRTGGGGGGGDTDPLGGRGAAASLISRPGSMPLGSRSDAGRNSEVQTGAGSGLGGGCFACPLPRRGPHPQRGCLCIAVDDVVQEARATPLGIALEERGCGDTTLEAPFRGARGRDACRPQGQTWPPRSPRDRHRSGRRKSPQLSVALSEEGVWVASW